MIILNVIKSYRNVVAVCDKEILGKTFEESINSGKDIKQLNVKESFYKGEEVTEEKAIEIMKSMATEDATFNIVGSESIEAAIKAKIVEKESIGKIQNIPFALSLL